MTAADDDWPEMIGNLWKAQKSWAWLTRVLGSDGSSSRVSRMFFNVVVQAVLLFKLETSVTTSRMVRTLGGFQHRVAIQITGRQSKWQVIGSW